jgi:polar amino acid transport system substrate-binding protein
MMKRAWMIGTLAVVLGLWSCLVSATASASTYRFVTLEYPPYEYSEKGVIKGAAVEIVKETFKLMGHEVKIEIWPWARSIEMLKNGDADGIFTFFKTPERESFALFSKEVVVQQKIAFWVRKDSMINFDGDLASLQNYRIGIVRKTSYGDRFDNAVKKGTLKVTETYTIEEAIKLLVKNRIDIWVSNYHGAVFELKKTGKYPEVKELTPSLQDTPAYVGFSKRRDLEGLRNEFDAALVKLKKSGRYAAILKAYAN